MPCQIRGRLEWTRPICTQGLRVRGLLCATMVVGGKAVSDSKRSLSCCLSLWAPGVPLGRIDLGDPSTTRLEGISYGGASLPKRRQFALGRQLAGSSAHRYGVRQSSNQRPRLARLGSNSCIVDNDPIGKLKPSIGGSNQSTELRSTSGHSSRNLLSLRQKCHIAQPDIGVKSPCFTRFTNYDLPKIYFSGHGELSPSLMYDSE